MRIRVWTNSLSSTGFVWSVQDAFELRKKHRIVGNFIGCPARAPRQTTFSGLPLVLMPEEIHVLLEEEAIELLDDRVLNQTATEAAKSAYEKFRSESYQEQAKAYRERRESEVNLVAKKIIDGKKEKLLKEKRKKHYWQKLRVSENAAEGQVIDLCDEDEIQLSDGQLQNLNEDTIIQRELLKIHDLSPETALIQTFHEHPTFPASEPRPVAEWSFPQTGTEELRASTFRELWKRGFYLTAGDKFGADFLAYPGDPLLFHSKFVIICFDGGLEGLEKCSEADLVAKCRLGTAVKKKILVSLFDQDEQTVKFKHLRWTAATD